MESTHRPSLQPCEWASTPPAVKESSRSAPATTVESWAPTISTCGRLWTERPRERSDRQAENLTARAGRPVRGLGRAVDYALGGGRGGADRIPRAGGESHSGRPLRDRGSARRPHRV